MARHVRLTYDPPDGYGFKAEHWAEFRSHVLARPLSDRKLKFQVLRFSNPGNSAIDSMTRSGSAERISSPWLYP